MAGKRESDRDIIGEPRKLDRQLRESPAPELRATVAAIEPFGRLSRANGKWEVVQLSTPNYAFSARMRSTRGSDTTRSCNVNISASSECNALLNSSSESIFYG